MTEEGDIMQQTAMLGIGSHLEESFVHATKNTLKPQ